MADGSFASLNPALLARKGGARPAMRPQSGILSGMSGMGSASSGSAAPNLEDLGWNDMGEEEQVRDSELVHLTPAPVNEETAAQSVANDLEAQAELGHGAAVKPAVHHQQDAIVQRMSDASAKIAERVPDNDSRHSEAAPAAAPQKPGPAKRKSSKSALSSGKRAAFTLRLDADRHLKLRLASAMKNRSAQAIVTQALDALLSEIEGLDLMAANAAPDSGKAR